MFFFVDIGIVIGVAGAWKGLKESLHNRKGFGATPRFRWMSYPADMKGVLGDDFVGIKNDTRNPQEVFA